MTNQQKTDEAFKEYNQACGNALNTLRAKLRAIENSQPRQRRNKSQDRVNHHRMMKNLKG